MALASRVPQGRVMDPQSRGLVIAVGDLPPHKARVLLMLALKTTRDVDELNRIFRTY